MFIPYLIKALPLLYDYQRQCKILHIDDPVRSITKNDLERLLRMKHVIDESSIIAITDKNGTITYVNKEFCRISGYSEKELLGQNHRILKSGYHPPQFYQGMWKAISSGRSWKGVVKNKAKDGSFYWVKTIIVPFFGDDGKPNEYISIRVDITEQKNAEEKLQKTLDHLFVTEQKYRGLFEESPNMETIISMDGIILECNKSYAQKLGYSQDGVVGKSIFEHVSEKDVEALRDSFETWKRTGKISDREIWFKRKDGTTFPTILNATTISDASGNVLGSNTIIKDITEEKESQAQLLKDKELSTIGTLSARLAHDLRNPLTTIKNTASMLKTQIGNDAENIRRLELMDRAIWRITLLIDDVLDFVKPKSLNLKSSSIRTIVETSIAMIEIPPTVKINLPIKDAQLKCDSEKLEIVFANLITNAIQAMNNTGQIYLRIKEEPENVIIEVEDTGPGIPDDALPKIFDPLFTTKSAGTGLGLVTCKVIIEQHGGSIDVVQKPTTFIIRIPKIPS